MVGAIFWETLRRTRLQMLYAGGLAALFGIMVVLLAPVMDAIKVVDVLQNLPPALLRAAGLGTDMSLLARPEGFIAIGFFGKFLLLFAAYPVVMGLRVTNAEEADGIMDVVLTLPVRRYQVILEKCAAFLVGLLVMLAMMAAALLIGAALVTLPLDEGLLLLLVFNLLPMLVFLLAATVFIGGIFGRRNIVIGIMTAFIAGSYILLTVADTADMSVGALPRRLSFFAYYDAAGVVQTGLNMGHLIGFFGLATVLLLAGMWLFQQRDIGG